MKALLAASALLMAASSAAAQQPAALEVIQPWSRPAAAGQTGAGYLTLMNRGKADALVGVETPVAAKAEIHTSTSAGGVMRMSREARTPVPAGAHVVFAPGGRHLMFMGLKKPLRVGERVPATLRFASGAVVRTEFVVQTAAPAPVEHHHH